MNKTVTINMSGVVFHIEEQAYDLLKKYLETLRSYFHKTEGGNDIIMDIEGRIAELFSERVNENKQALLVSDVEAVMELMGRPESFVQEEDAPKKESQNENRQQDGPARPLKRKVYRDPDDKVLGGVCSGIAAYFNLDPLWFRLIFIISFFGFGTGFFIYLLLWIIIPEASNTAEKLEMRGEEINIANIEKTVKEEIEGLRSRVSGFENEIKTKQYKSRFSKTMAQIINFFASLFGGLFKVIGKIIGGILIFIGVIILIAFLGMFFGSDILFNINPDGISRFSLNPFLDLIFPSSDQIDLARIGIILVFFIPLIMLIFAGIKMIFKIEGRHRLLKGIALAFWSVGLIILVFIVSKISNEFSTMRKQKSLSPVMQPLPGKILRIEALTTMASENDDDVIINDENRLILARSGDLLKMGFVELDVEKSSADSVQIEVIRQSYGNTKKEATSRIESMAYEFNQNDTVLKFNDYFSVPVSDKFRGQKIKIIVKVPVGRTIYLDKSAKEIIYDIDNVTNTWDGDMLDRRWIMTSEGLSCVDCDGIKSSKNKKIRKKVIIRNKDGEVIEETILGDPETPEEIEGPSTVEEVEITKEI